MSVSIPEKKYFKIGEVSKITGLEPHVLRFWEAEFSCIRPKKDSGNQRLYTRNDLEKILEVKVLLYEENFTIAGAKQKLKKTKPRSKDASPAIPDLEFINKIKNIKSGLEELKDMLR